MAAPTSNCRTLKEPLANGEPSIHGPIETSNTSVPSVGNWADCSFNRQTYRQETTDFVEKVGVAGGLKS